MAFLQRLSVVGVWVPVFLVLAMASLWSISSALWSISPRLAGVFGGPIAVLGPVFVFALAHVLAFCGLLGSALLLAGRSIHPKLTLVSAIVGLILGFVVLARVYLNVQLF